MTGKITAIVAAAILIGSAGAASAQATRHGAYVAHRFQAPEAGYYHFRANVPAKSQVDPLAGTVFEGIAPY